MTEMCKIILHSFVLKKVNIVTPNMGNVLCICCIKKFNHTQIMSVVEIHIHSKSAFLQMTVPYSRGDLIKYAVAVLPAVT